ncbi:hypothetical protein SAMN05421820_106328 [Pedobacter steynii]|uniref:Lipoprotein n=1 Tax=Pedobacter steynii TaxID=430522 RepID=A0A1G9Z2H5_9SPHI|nr:hypothetical protein [Pedobacter steynii]NQX39926.1 hypothetical protein [Pedobacter steynii]SDN15602.1 hypothetical protein SAMN05421820_106328 [Pedobacter steynii]
MKRIFILIIPILVLFSCKKENNTPRIETISKGSKWGLQIGSSYSDVYAQLQQLGKEKNVNDVDLVKQQSFSNPDEIKNRVTFYNLISLETNTGKLERVTIQFDGDKIISIDAGSALPKESPKWPLDVPDEIAIYKNDPINALYTKLKAIYQIPAYKNYQITLPGKPLGKPFDPAMANYEEWAFSFFMDVKPGKTGRSSVRLYFKNGKLSKIKHEYEEFDVYNS